VNHRRSPRGYHSRLAAGTLSVVLVADCAPLNVSGPPAGAMPRAAVALEGRLARPWRSAAMEVLWEGLPHALTDSEARAIRSYGYPPRRAMFSANTGPHQGVEIVLPWARFDNSRELVPAAVSAAVVAGTAGLPPELECWRTSRPGPTPPVTREP
jgi:hypothetical protein